MALRQMHTAETMFIDDGLTDGANFPPSSNAVYDALQSAIELPSVTAADDGDVLTVVSGAWAKATPSGGGGGLVLSGTLDQVEGTVTFDKSYNDVKSALEDGKTITYFIEDMPLGGATVGDARGTMIIGTFENESLQGVMGTFLNIPFEGAVADADDPLTITLASS